MKKLLFALTLVLCLAISMVAFTSCGGNGEDEGEACEHIWATAATPDKEATCTAEGSKSIKCIECGEKKADSVEAIPATGHSYNNGQTIAPTCTDAGTSTKTCTTCGYVNTTTTPAKGHTWANQATVDVAATCTTAGSKSVKCTACPAVKDGTTETIPAGHVWADKATTIIPATCTTSGTKGVKCVNRGCTEIKPETTEVIEPLGHDGIETVIAPTLFSNGRIKGTCASCGFIVNEETPKAAATGTIFTAESQGTFTDAHTFDEILDGGNKHFYPTDENPDGQALYIEYSMLWTEAFVNASVGQDYMLMGRFDSAQTAYDSQYDTAYALSIGANDTWTDPKTPGYFDVLAKDGDPVYGDYTYGSDTANCPSIGGYGWHRIGIVIKQIEKDGSYLLNATLYVDGVKISSHNIKPRSSANLLYTVENGDYKDIDLDRVVRAYYIGESETNGATADFEIADLYVTAGNGFVKTVTKLDTAVSTAYTGFDGEEREANSYFAYEMDVAEKLFDETLDSVEYPVDTLEPADGYIDHAASTGGTNYHRYYEHADKKVAFISVKDIAFNTVNIGVASGTSVRYTFLSKMVSVNEVVSYAIDYRTFVTTAQNTAVLIPANAEYLVIYYQDNADTKYLPESITFTNTKGTLSDKLKDNTLGSFSYPVTSIKPSQGTIAAATLQYIPNFDWVGSFVDIRDCAFEKVEITVNAGTGNVSYVFLTEFPDIYDYVSFAGDGSPVVEIKGQPVGTTYTLDIPDDAVCFYVYMHDEGPVYYTPASIIFLNTDADEPTGDSTGSDDTTGNPDDEDNKDLTTYSYPMETVVASNGQITHGYKMGNEGKTHKFRTDGKERVAFIDITDLDYNTLTVTSNGETGFLSFLTKLPTAHDEVVSYAPNYNDMLEINGTVTLAIPYCARYIAVTYHYDSYVSCLPASMVFSNTADAPSEMLKNDALDSYAYPMDTLKESQGTVADDGNKYVANFNWTCAFISLEGCVFDKVVFEVNAAKGFVSYGFLTEYPTLDQVVSFAGDATAMTTYEGEEPGTLITADIPDDAKVLVINWFGWANGAPDYTKPESITFIKDTDAGDEA